MNRFILLLALLCCGCASSGLETRRETLTRTYQDTLLPLPERVIAFDALLATFTPGTRETTIDRYTSSISVIKTRIDSVMLDDGTFIPGNHFALLLHAPDGTDRQLLLYKDRIHYSCR